MNQTPDQSTGARHPTMRLDQVQRQCTVPIEVLMDALKALRAAYGASTLKPLPDDVQISVAHAAGRLSAHIGGRA